GMLLGSAVIGAGSIVVASQAKLHLAFDAPRIQAPAAQVAPAGIRVAAVTAGGVEDARRAVRVVYVGPITAR
ncbi:hypothetical protein, partial [Salinarimonas soli]|uniref:hypothetical protein n=1 Tax=Salinarimonas soli TaxID=1638099 RepID=UPI001661DC9D